MISNAIDNGRHNTVGGGCGSAHQAVSKFAKHNIDMVSWVSRKYQTRAGVSGDVYKSLECVTKTDSKFPNRVLVWMKDQLGHSSIYWEYHNVSFVKGGSQYRIDAWEVLKNVKL